MDPEELKAELAKLQEAFEAGVSDVKALVDQRDEEIKTLGKATEETGTRLDEAGKLIEEVRSEMTALTERLDTFEAEAKRLPQGAADAPLSIGEQFIQSDVYKDFNPTSDVKSGAFQTKSLHHMERKEAVPAGSLTGATLGNVPGYLYDPQRVAEIIRAPERQVRIRDLIPLLPTTSGAIEFVRETGFTNEAAAVAETAEKPQSSLEFEIVSLAVKTLAHWIPVTRQILADAVQLAGYINTRMIYGLKLAEDTQILYGDGTGANLSGILTDPNIQTYNMASHAGDTYVDAIRRMITLVRLAEYPATGIVVHPNDWEVIELLKGTNGHYIWVKVTEGGEQRLWRVPVVDSPVINESEVLVGSFALGATLWDREQAAIRVSDSHNDFFIRNMLAILAEERLCLTVFRPEAFVLGTLTAES